MGEAREMEGTECRVEEREFRAAQLMLKELVMMAVSLEDDFKVEGGYLWCSSARRRSP